MLLLTVLLLSAGLIAGGAEARAAAKVLEAPPELVAQIPAPADSDPRQARGTYVGTGKKAPYVGLVIQGRKVAIYVCDGSKLGDWFGGRSKKGKITARSAKRTVLEAKLSRGVVKGTVQVRGKRARAFVAKRPKGKKIGLFRRPSLEGHGFATVVLPTGVRGIGRTPEQVIGLKGKGDCTKNPGQNVYPGGCLISCETIRTLLNQIAATVPLTNPGSDVQNAYIQDFARWALQSDLNGCG